jgi:hypothetical protein
MSTAVCRAMPDRLATYSVSIPFVDIVVGYVRLDVSERKWVARTPGCPRGTSAAEIKRFETRAQAIAWLVERESAAPERGLRRGVGRVRAA